MKRKQRTLVTSDMEKKILEMFKQNKTYDEIATHVGLARSTVGRVLTPLRGTRSRPRAPKVALFKPDSILEFINEEILKTQLKLETLMEMRDKALPL